MDEIEKKPKASVFDDLTNLRLTPEEAGNVGSTEVLFTVPTGKPGRQEFFRVNPDPGRSLTTSVYVDKDNRDETYLVMPEMRGVLLGEARAALLVETINRQGVVKVWPLVLPTDGGTRVDNWYESKREAMKEANTSWIRMVPDMSLGAYRIFRAQGDLPEPVWPGRPFPEILKLTFGDRVIDNEDHPIVRRLRGLT